MSNTLKDDITDICEKHKINESDLLRRAAATFIQDLNSKPDEQSKYLFVWCIPRIYRGYYLPKRPDYHSNQVFFVLTKKDVKEGVYPLHRTHLNLLSNEMKTIFIA